jgi:hypothetical protein
MPFLDRMNCEHSNLPTEYTAAVPAYVAPASLAETWQQQGFVGDATTPWSTMNFAYALLDHVGAEVPPEWPAFEPPGVATSWTCSQNGIAEGIRIEGDRSVRCQGPDCGAWYWRVPDDELLDPESIDPIPTDLEDWAASPNPFQDWCE